MFQLNSNLINPGTNSRSSIPISAYSEHRTLTKDGRYWGPFFIQPRVGTDDKMIMIYKLRTMHPFSSHKNPPLFDKQLGKFSRKHRYNHVGGFLRKYFIDETPQIINLLRGELKLVGLRPQLITDYLSFPEDIRNSYSKAGPSGMNILYAFDGKASIHDPDCEKQRTAFIREFYEQYEEKPFLTTM